MWKRVALPGLEAPRGLSILSRCAEAELCLKDNNSQSIPFLHLLVTLAAGQDQGEDEGLAQKRKTVCLAQIILGTAHTFLPFWK